jgi:hypothetical protein
VQVQLLQREAELADATSAADSSSKAWRQEQAHLQEAVDEWREKAIKLQDEVSNPSFAEAAFASASCTTCIIGSVLCRGLHVPDNTTDALLPFAVVAVQLEHKHNEALATSKAHSQEVAKLQV